MNSFTGILFSTILIGTAATLVMDAWCWLRPRALGAPPNYAMVGRWLLHMRHGQFRHVTIAASEPQKGERTVGWVAHYLTGIGFAGLLISIVGTPWLEHPTLRPALATGMITVAAPFLLMQPGMGMGIAAANTARPGQARLQSLATHLVFGFGLYLGGLFLNVTGLP